MGGNGEQHAMTNKATAASQRAACWQPGSWEQFISTIIGNSIRVNVENRQARLHSFCLFYYVLKWHQSFVLRYVKSVVMAMSQMTGSTKNPSW